MIKGNKVWFFLLAGLLIAGPQASAIINEIVVEGNQRVETPTVLSFVDVKLGSSFTEEQREEILKNMYASGLFADVVVQESGSSLVITVQENKIINAIAFEGNERIKEELMLAELGLRPREVYTPARAQEAAQKIRDMYRLTGRYAAKVEPKIIERDEGRIDLVFEIDEGKPTRVNRIIFVGNSRFSDSQLEKIVMTKESRWYRIFTVDDSYDPNRLAYDRELLRNYYLQHGYVDFKVKSVVAELDPQDQDFFITFTVDEGERYRVGNVSIDSHLPKFDPTNLSDELSFDKGDWYDRREVEKSMERLVDEINERGVAFIDIQPKITPNPETLTVDVEFLLEEGPKLYVNRINIIGNDRTNEEVIRREFRFVEGDPLNKTKLKRSEQRLKNTEYFRKVKLKEEKTSSPDKVDIIAEVEDQPTGSMRFAAGYSTSDGVMGSVSLQESNLMGQGLILNGSAMVAQQSSDFRAGLADPYFLGRRLLVGAEAFHTQRKYDTRKAFSGGYSARSTGGTVNTGYEITERLTQDWAYTLRRDKISHFKSSASPFLRLQRGDWTVSSVSHDIFYDRRDNGLNPTEGYYMSVGNSIAGLGGDVEYSKNGASAGVYCSLDDDHQVVWSNKASGGALIRFRNKIRAVDRYNLGGQTLRGFDESGIGPRDVTSGDALGGRYYYRFSSEVSFPIGLPNELGVKGLAFVDVGSVWESKNKTTTVGGKTFVVRSNAQDPRVGIGGGVNWKSPFGPVGVTFAKAVKKKGVDKTRTFMVNFGTTF